VHVCACVCMCVHLCACAHVFARMHVHACTLRVCANPDTKGDLSCIHFTISRDV